MTSRLKDDPRNRIFVGQGFHIRDVAEPLIPALEAFLKRCPDAIALLEFTSPGYNQRQVDCALVSPGGIDLIEVKNKQGLVTGSADDEWRVTYRGRTDPVVNSKAGEQENPYRQAHRTADDLQGGLKRWFDCRVRVTPLVLLPRADLQSRITPHSNVGLALGMGQFTQALRSAFKTYGGGWEGADYLELPNRLGLQPMNLAFVGGRVTDAELRQGVPDVDVWADVAGQRHTTQTDEGGSYSFAVALGNEIRLGFSPPERFLSPDVNSIRADQQYLTVDDVRLANRYSSKTEDEMRDEVLREMGSRLQQQVSQAQESWMSTQASMGLVIDDLAGQLKAAQLRLAQQEEQLQDRVRRQGTPDRLPLPVQVRQANALRVVQEQRGQVEGALQTLQVADNTEQRDAVRQVLDVLTRLELSARRELTPALAAALPVQVLGTTPRQPPTAPAASEPDYVDVEVRQDKAPPAASAPGPQAWPQPGPPPARKSVGWPLLAVALLAAGPGGGAAAWIATSRVAATGPAGPGPATPAPVAAPASTPPQAASVEAEAAPVVTPTTVAAVVSEPVPSPAQTTPEPEPSAVPEARQPAVASTPSAPPAQPVPAAAAVPVAAPPPAPVSTPATRSPAAPSTISVSAPRPDPQPPAASATPTSPASEPPVPATPPPTPAPRTAASPAAAPVRSTPTPPASAASTSVALPSPTPSATPVCGPSRPHPHLGPYRSPRGSRGRGQRHTARNVHFRWSRRRGLAGRSGGV